MGVGGLGQRREKWVQNILTLWRPSKRGKKEGNWNANTIMDSVRHYAAIGSDELRLSCFALLGERASFYEDTFRQKSVFRWYIACKILHQICYAICSWTHLPIHTPLAKIFALPAVYQKSRKEEKGLVRIAIRNSVQCTTACRINRDNDAKGRQCSAAVVIKCNKKTKTNITTYCCLLRQPSSLTVRCLLEFNNLEIRSNRTWRNIFSLSGWIRDNETSRKSRLNLWECTFLR